MGRRTQKNPWIGVNYIPDNPRMEVPPPYFLQRIYDQDAMLVVIPSRKTPFAYVIARRKQFGPGISPEAIDATYSHPDTKMCVLHGCVPVCLMFRTAVTGGWDPDPIIRKLQARDLWAHGGAEKVATMLEEQEEAEKEKIRRATRDDLYNRSGDAWRSYQARTGASSIKFHEPRKPRTKAAAQQPSPSRSTAGSGIIIETGFTRRGE